MAAWARLWPALALATVVSVSALVVAAQPVRSPWWTYADADASYAATGLNMLLGRTVTFVDHPGLQVSEAAAVGFGVDLLLHEHSVSQDARQAYVDRLLLDLDRARPVFRGIAIACYLAGALLAFLLLGRLLGHWTWGLAAGLAWLAAPGLIPMSIQLRPDVPFAVACLVFAFLIGRALEGRSVGYYAAAAAVGGFAVMLKLHALGLIAPLALAAAWRPPADGWHERLRSDLAKVARRPLVLALAGSWVALAVLMNWERVPFTPTGAEVQVLLLLFTAIAAWAVAVWMAPRLGIARVVQRIGALIAVLGAAFVAGLLLPVTLQLPAGLQALVNIGTTMSGGGVQEGVDSFSTPFWRIGDFVSHQVLLVFALAAAAGLIGLRRRDPVPVVWAFGALVLAVLVFARPPNVHYFAPAFALALPAALWAMRSAPGRTSLLVWPVVVYLIWPSIAYRDRPALEAERFAATVAPGKAYVDRKLRDHEVALVPSYWPFEDSRYFELVNLFVDYSAPDVYPYRYLPATSSGLAFAEDHHLRPRYYIGPQANDVVGKRQLVLGDIGPYVVARDPAADLVLDIVAGPGVNAS